MSDSAWNAVQLQLEPDAIHALSGFPSTLLLILRFGRIRNTFSAPEMFKPISSPHARESSGFGSIFALANLLN
jgi:hypothetical protein